MFWMFDCIRYLNDILIYFKMTKWVKFSWQHTIVLCCCIQRKVNWSVFFPARAFNFLIPSSDVWLFDHIEYKMIVNKAFMIRLLYCNVNNFHLQTHVLITNTFITQHFANYPNILKYYLTLWIWRTAFTATFDFWFLCK